MIVFALTCDNGHRFDAWFRDGAAYDAQSAGGDIVCPFCDSRQVAKAPMAPNIVRSASRARDGETGGEDAATGVKAQLDRLRRHVEENCDYVGEAFSEEARRIFYGESEQRNIYGEASDDDAAALKDEGIEVRRIPWHHRRDD